MYNKLKKGIKMLSKTNFTPILDSLFEHPSVYAVVISNQEGFPLAFRSSDASFGSDEAELVAALVSSLVGKAVHVVTKLDRGKVNFFTIDSVKGEILIALETDYVVIAMKKRRG